MANDDNFHIPRREGMTPAEKEFLDAAERIGREVAGWSDEQVAAYIKDKGLEELVDPERMDEMLRQAMIAKRKPK